MEDLKPTLEARAKDFSQEAGSGIGDTRSVILPIRVQMGSE